MVVAQKTEESDMADNMLLLTRNLLRIAIYHITYIRGLFHEKYFSEKSVLSPEMKNEKLIPVDHDLGRLIDWMEKGVCDALQKKYLKTLLFCICEKEEGPMIEEYAFSFSYPNTNSEEIAMIVSRTGSKNGSTTFKSNASELTPDQMKRYGCKMIRTLVSLMKIVDSKPKMEERTVLVKLLYYDDVTTEDYEPPCAENEAINIWNKNPLKMEVGNVNSKHLVLALKVKGVLDPCDDNNAKCGWDEMKVDSDFDIDGDFSDTQVQLSGRRFGYVLCTSQKGFKFMLDSGATHHICNDEAIMRNLREVKKEDRLYVYSAGGKELSAERMGCIDLKNFSLNPVGLIPSMQFNVVSVGQLANQGLMICCGNGQFSVYDMTRARIVGEGYLDNIQNEYVFRTLKWSPEAEKLVEVSKNDTDERNDDLKGSLFICLSFDMLLWLIDTGCAQHLVPDVDLLTNVRHDKRPFQTAFGTIWSSHRGKYKAGKLVLNDVLCCKSVKDNLMSGPSLDKAGYRMTFCGKTCTLVHKDGLELRGVAIQDVSNNMYYLTHEEEEGRDNRVSAQGDAKEAKRRRLE